MKVYTPDALNVNVGLAFDLEVEQGLQEATLPQFGQEVVVVHLDRLGFCPVAVDDAGYVALATGLTGGPLACPRPYLGDKIGDLTSHVILHKVKGILQGCMPEVGRIVGNRLEGKQKTASRCRRRKSPAWGNRDIRCVWPKG